MTKSTLNSIVLVTFLAVASLISVAVVTKAQTTTVKSDLGDVEVTTDSKGTFVKDTDGNVGHTDGGTTKEDHERVVDMFKD